MGTLDEPEIQLRKYITTSQLMQVLVQQQTAIRKKIEEDIGGATGTTIEDHGTTNAGVAASAIVGSQKLVGMSNQLDRL